MQHTTKAQTKCGRQRLHDVELTGQRFLSVLEKEAGRRLSALFKQFNFASRHEVDGLLRRVAQLERLTRSDQPVDQESLPSMSASAIPGPPAQKMSLRRYAEFLWDEV